MSLRTLKPPIYVANVPDHDIQPPTNNYAEILKKYADEEHSEVVVICGKFEADLAEVTDPADRKDFMDSVGL